MKLKDSIIIILAVVIAIVVGVFVGFKLSESKNDNPTTNNGTTNNNNVNNNENNNNENVNKENTNNGDAETEKDFSLVEAEKLMSKYIFFNDFRGKSYISQLSDSTKNGVAIQNMAGVVYDSNRTICYELFGEKYYDDEEIKGYCGNNPEMQKYSYQDVLEEKKKLFGDDSILKKEHFDYQVRRYLYSEKTNSFIDTGSYGGGDSCDYAQTNISNYEVVNGILYIYTEQKNFGCDDNMVSVFKYKYTFKKQDSGYYMAAVEKIN